VNTSDFIYAARPKKYFAFPFFQPCFQKSISGFIYASMGKFSKPLLKSLFEKRE